VSSILYGNLRAEIAGGAGTRIQRARIRPAAAVLPASRQPQPPPKPLLLGRDQEAADVFAAIRVGQPAGFYAACGFGKTTLLRYIVAAAAERALAPSCIYLRAHGDRVGDLLQDLVTRLYDFDEPVKLTQQECGQLLGQVSAVIAIDDLGAGVGQLDYLFQVLPGGHLVIGSAQPVLGRRGRSRQLRGLPDESALALIEGCLGRSLAAGEVAEARSLAAAVDGQPLHLRQCAALAREGGHTLGSLARQAAGDPEALDRLSISALARQQRRALAALALAAGALLPADVVDAIGQVSYLAQWLQSLQERGLAEQREDRFGLPACKARGYRELLLRDLDLAVAARGLSDWLTAADPTADQAQSAAEAALTMMEFAAERGEWTSVLQLARAAERVLFLAGRWEAWHDTLGRGLDAARASGDKAAEAFFVHQQGTLAFCLDQLEEADRLLTRALALREQIGEADGADVTRHNLRLLKPPGPPSTSWPRVPRRVVNAVGGFLATLALVVSTVLITGVLRGSSEPAKTSATNTAGSASSSRGTDSSSASPASGGSSASVGTPIAQLISFTSAPPSPAVARGTYAVTVAGGDSGNRVALRVAPGSESVCSISAGVVTFGDPGQCVIDADQAGNLRYQPAPEAQQVITVTAIPQSVRFTAPAQGWAGHSVTLAAAGGGSGEPVKFAVDPAGDPGACAVSGARGATLTYEAAGQCVIDANQAGDVQYQAAPQAQQSITVNLVPQAVSFTSTPPASPAPGATYAVTAKGGGSPNPVTFGIDPSSSGSACTITGTVVTFGQLGRCVIDANQEGNGQYQPAPQVQQVVAVAGLPQSITITSKPPSDAHWGVTYPVTVKGGGSPNPVTFGIDPSSSGSACTITGTVVTFGQPGLCVVDANQAGDARYRSAPQVQQVILVTGVPQSILFTASASGQVGQKAVTLRAKGGGSGSPVVFSVDPASDPGACKVSGTDGATLSYTAIGRCVIDANQAGDPPYLAAPQVQRVTVVTGIPQSIRFTPLTTGTVGDKVTLQAAGGGSGNAVVFNVDPNQKVCTVSAPSAGNPNYTVNYAGPGPCVVDANQAGDSRYQPAAQVQRTIVVTYPAGIG
jgi:hypothetical protein